MVVYVFNIVDRQILVILQESIKADSGYGQSQELATTTSTSASSVSSGDENMDTTASTSTNANGLVVLAIHNGIGFYILRHTPGEHQVAYFIF